MKYILDKAVQANSTAVNYQCTITWRAGSFVGDEPESIGGKDTGPDPFSLLAASLASCTVSTLRLYCNRKNWPLESVQVAVNFYSDEIAEALTVFERKINVKGNFDNEQLNRLLQIAKSCPVSKILTGSATIETNLQVNT